MALKLYNTRTRTVEEFRPLDPPHVRMYVCGLTPSAEAHLGHARSYIFFDVLRRYLMHLGYDVTHVQNVTDIDDRSIAAANATGETWHAIVTRYYESFKASMRVLGVLEPDLEPYATQYIPSIVGMIERLVAAGLAYAAQDGVYYSVSKFPRYGELSNRKLEDLEAGARVEVDESKRDPLDFALWKFAKPGEPTWPSPWGDGRPGWHIECSAMSRALLDPPGDGFDLHGGGADLIFPHHENEIAQSEPLMARPPMANFWVYGGLLLHDARKMSKSLGNFEPLARLLERHDPQAIRLLFLQTGYSKVMNFTEDSLSGAAAALERVKAAWRGSADRSEAAGPLTKNIERALDEDFNTAQAVAEIFARIASGEPFDRSELSYVLRLLGIAPGDAWANAPKAQLPSDFLDRLRGELASQVSFDGATPEQAVQRVLEARAAARARKEFAESDRLRDALRRCGVVVEDSKDGTSWAPA